MENSPLRKLIEECRQKQEEYLFLKGKEPVQLSLFKDHQREVRLARIRPASNS